MISKAFCFIQYRDTMNIPNGIYNARYNKEPAVIRFKENRPVYVSFIGFLNADGENRSSSIFLPQGIINSSVELLVPGQELPNYA